MEAGTDVQSRGAKKELVLTRVIDAPAETVFEVWTKPEHLARWWGPQGFTLPSCDVDFRVGGALRYQMRSPSGEDHWLRGVVLEIVAPKRIVFSFAWGDEERSTQPETRVTVTFEERDGKTTFTLRHSGFDSVDAVRDHEDGWAQALDRMAAHAASSSRKA
ncbi:putative glutathione S-transferase-related transmembrane protein [Labilithrix luteola]|uniref:Putative glutathione S-transferase-related transmembrane protein n=1 Tax=Labilithrix luteola TaxID=1391654 RepID=A0A0K1Q591_9BACT|nr:SRPBCC domain-containing protein [Labilithrix luteola]AKV00575.1 putative glutathione S-transferase-related transmembrane protein [Labilithrix luteola]